MITNKSKKGMFKAAAAAAAIAVLTGTLSGCMFDASIEGLLSPPKLTEAQTAIYNALILNTGSQIELVYPRTGEYLSPFVLYDLDGRNERLSAEEAIVFYRETSPQNQNESSLRINILDQQDGEWVSVGDRPLSGVDIESISFYSFFGSDRPDNILVSCSGLGQAENSMYVLEYTNGELREHFSGRYSIMDIITPADGSNPKLFWVGRDNTNFNRAYLGGVRSTSTNSEENAEPVFESCAADFYPNEVNVQRITRQRLSDNSSLMFLDYSMGDNTYGSLVFSCSFSNLYLVCVPSEDLVRKNNSNVPTLYCMDIDGDGRINIPVTVPMSGYEFLTIPEQYFWVDWYSVDEENNFSISQKFNTYVSLDMDYVFYVPVRWQGFVSARRTDNTVNFFTFNGLYDGVPSIENILLSVCVASELPAANEGWELYAEAKGGNIYIKSPSPEDPMTLTADELERCLSVLNTAQTSNASSLKPRR